MGAPAPPPPFTTMSGALIWECVKSNSCFIKKSKNCPVMTTEPANLLGFNAFKFSGLANPKAFDVSVQTTGKKQTVVVVKRSSKPGKARKPGMVLYKSGIKKSAKKGPAQVEKAAMTGYYRPDLKALAVKKYLKIKQSFKKPCQEKANKKK